MPIWAVAFYDEEFDFRGPRRGVVKAKTVGDAGALVKAQMGKSMRATLTFTIVRDEDHFQDGYHDLPSN